MGDAALIVDSFTVQSEFPCTGTAADYATVVELSRIELTVLETVHPERIGQHRTSRLRMRRVTEDGIV